jgi:hypothetical protein
LKVNNDASDYVGASDDVNDNTNDYVGVSDYVGANNDASDK